MTQYSALRPLTAPAAARGVNTSSLLAAGLLAGPLFTVVVAAQIVGRAGFDLRRHPISALSLGDAGWIQIANFVAAGLLSALFALGVRRAARGGPAGTWGPILLAVYAAGLVTAGLFVTDGAYGFPAGAPAGLPSSYSWHAMVHGAAATLAFVSLSAACGVFACRFFVQRRPGWAATSIATGIAVPALAVWPGAATASVRLAVATLLAWTWVTALAAHLRTDR